MKWIPQPTACCLPSAFAASHRYPIRKWLQLCPMPSQRCPALVPSCPPSLCPESQCAAIRCEWNFNASVCHCQCDRGARSCSYRQCCACQCVCIIMACQCSSMLRRHCHCGASVPVFKFLCRCASACDKQLQVPLSLLVFFTTISKLSVPSTMTPCSTATGVRVRRSMP